MKKSSWLIIILFLCITATSVWTGSRVCGWFDALLNRSGCASQLSSAGMVTEMVFSPDGQLLATLSGDRRVKLWNMENMTLQYTLPRSDNTTVYDFFFTPDGKSLAVVLGGSIEFWNVSREVLSGTLDIIPGNPVAFSSDWTALAMGDSGGGLELWQLNEGVLLHKLQRSQFSGLHSIQALAFSPNSNILASGTADGVVRLWQVKDGTLLQELKGHTHGIRSVAFSPDGAILASGSADNTVRLWQVSDGTGMRILSRPRYRVFSNQITTIAFSPDGSILAGGGGNSVQLWRVSDGMLLYTLPHSRAVWQIAFSPDGRIFATAQARGPVSLFEVQQWNLTSHKD